MNNLSLFGSVASILGLLVSIYVLREIRNLKKKFLFRARVPQLLNAIKGYSKGISSKLRDFEGSKRELETDLSKCNATLKNLSLKVDGNAKEITKRLTKKIRKQKQPLKKDEIWEIYNDLQALIESLSHLQKDIKWG